MKRVSILFVVSYIFIPLLFTQENLIRDPKFEETTLERIYHKRFVEIDSGKWFTNDTLGVKITGDEHQGTAISYYVSSPDIYNSFLGQRIYKIPNSTLYSVEFSARSMIDNVKPVINIYLKINDKDSLSNKFFLPVGNSLLNKFPIVQIKLSSNWNYYQIRFDLSKVALIRNLQLQETDKDFKVVNSTDIDLADFYIAFSSSTEKALFRLTDISMIIDQ